MHVLKLVAKSLPAFLESRGYGNINIVYPLPDLCTDNAAMIAWAGMEMFEAGWASDLNIRAVRRWSLDDESEDKGILGIGGWIHASTHQ